MWQDSFCEEPDWAIEGTEEIDCVMNRCRVPEGEFWRGSGASEDECPVRSIYLNQF